MVQFDLAVMDVAKKLDERKALDIIIIDISRTSILADTFIVCSGTNPNMLRMLADEAEKTMKEHGIPLRRVEGYREGRWIVCDFGGLMVHIFHKEERKFYEIERLWRTEDNYLNYKGQTEE